MDVRPANCRFRLQDEGKPYGRSSCSACGKGIYSGLGKQCSVAPDLMAELVEAAEELYRAVCGDTGFVAAVRADSGLAYPWPALDAAEERLAAALAKIKEPQT